MFRVFDFLFKTPIEYKSSWKTKRRLSDPRLSLFDIPTYGIFKDEAFSKSLLDDLKFEEKLEEIQPRSSKVSFMQYIPKDSKKSKQGTIYIFEVGVFCGENKLEVRERKLLTRRRGKKERDHSQKRRFFSSKLENATRVIRIFSTEVRSIEAKLRVYQEYEEDIGSKNILLLHEFEDIDDICDLSEDMQYKDLYDDLKLFEECIPGDELPSIVEDATDRVVYRDNIRQICSAVHIRDGTADVGTAGNRSYVCYSVFTVRRIKKILAKETMESLAKSLGSEICKGILRHIKAIVQTKLNHEFKDFDINLSTSTLLRMIAVIAAAVMNFIVSLFGFIHEAINLTWMAVDVNSREWRDETADEIYSDFIERKRSFKENIVSAVRKMCVGTQNELRSIMKKIDAYKKVITLIDQRALVNQWKKREVIDREALIETCPSFLNYIAGVKNGKSVVVVFLQDDEKKRTKEYFTRNSKHPVDDYEIVNVNNDFRKNSNDVESDENLIEKIERKKMQNLIENMKVKVLSLHSNVVGLGVGCMSGMLAKPCFVLYCLDKTLVPFGEKELPNKLGGYPVELKEDYIMFGHAQSVEDGCSDMQTVLYKDGSVHLRVKSRRKKVSLFRNRFLTPAHVAPTFVELYKTGTLLVENPFSERTEKAVQPPLIKSDDKKIVEGKNDRTGTRETKVEGGALFHEGKSIELHDIQVVEEDDLRDGELYFTNEGQITKCTDGTLVGVGFTIAIDLPLPAGVFVCFPGCIIIQHPDVRHLKEGDKGSGILTKKPNQPYKPFGIALAVLKCTKQTAVCNMREIFKEFDFFVYEK